MLRLIVRELIPTLVAKVDVEQHISENIYKLNASRFLVKIWYQVARADASFVHWGLKPPTRKLKSSHILLPLTCSPITNLIVKFSIFYYH
jgi:hypothetical protein